MCVPVASAALFLLVSFSAATFNECILSSSMCRPILSETICTNICCQNIFIVGFFVALFNKYVPFKRFVESFKLNACGELTEFSVCKFSILIYVQHFFYVTIFLFIVLINYFDY